MILSAAVAVATALAAPFAGGPDPTVRIDSYQLVVRTTGGFVRYLVIGTERFLASPSRPALPDVVVRGGETLVGATATTRGRKIRNRYPAQPDAASGLDDAGLRLAQFAVAEARAGLLTLVPDTLASRDVYRVEIDLAANPCRHLAAGTATLWLTRATLLPKRLEVKRDGTTQAWTYRYSGFNQVFPIHLLDPPVLGKNPEIVGNGFTRATPEEASGPLPFVPRLPATLPSGFRLATSGWAPRGARTGVDGVNRREPHLFAAVYVRGWERIEITERVAANGIWRHDPFARTCLTMRRGHTLVGTRPARYGIGPEIASHLWWRDGSLLYTVSGPYGKRDLQAIGASMKKIS